MSTIPAKPTPQPSPAETVEGRFRRLEKTWLDETAILPRRTMFQ
jgi:hypothetical protein